MIDSAGTGPDGARETAVAQFAKVRGFLAGDTAATLEHSELEGYIKTEGFELLRLLLQAHFDLRTFRELRLAEATATDGIVHGAVERSHERPLATIVGTVVINRFAYRHRGEANLYPADAILNLPAELHSHGLRELAAVESSRGSFEEARDAVVRACGVSIAKRQVKGLAQAAAVDFGAFYETGSRPVAEAGEVIVISADGKGVVMRPDGLRPATADAAAKAKPKLQGRLSPERSATASAWRSWAPSTPSNRCRDPRPMSWPMPTPKGPSPPPGPRTNG